MIEIQNVTRDFKTDSASFRALSSINLKFQKGRFHTLLGPSGCGKTTLLRLIAGFETPTTGDILHNGRSILSLESHQRGFPMVFQSYALFPHMTVFENIAYGLRVRSTPSNDVRRHVEEIAEKLQLTEHLFKLPMQLSGGQQQRVALARSLILKPEVLLFDEPLSNLDSRLRVLLREEIRSLQIQNGFTAIYVTHDQEEAMSMSDHVVVMNHGCVMQTGSPEQIYFRPETEFVARFLGDVNILSPTWLSQISFSLKDLDFINSDPKNYSIAVRPEQIYLSTSENALKGRLLKKMFLGHRTRLTLSLHQQKLVADVPAQEATGLQTGMEIGFVFAPKETALVRPSQPDKTYDSILEPDL
ncbi:MAG: ABC transporter ATP-binding protein [Oligoflexia bacterium]|nr:ABC transporter ATP-binding protein [Oligoflexia bacterium]